MKKISIIFALIFVSAAFCTAGPSTDFQVAKSAYEDGLYQIAKNQLVQFIKKNPENEKTPEAYFLLGESLLNLEKFNEARGAYAQALKSRPLAEAALYRTACAYYREGKENECAEAFKKYLNSVPEGRFAEIASYRLGECLLKTGNPEAAARAFSKIPELNPKSEYLHKALYSKGAALMKSGDFKEAAKTFDLLLSHSPEKSVKPEILYWSAHSRSEAGEGESAYALFTKIYKEFPENTFADSALYQAGNYRIAKGDYKEAAAHMLALAENYENSPLVPDAKLKMGFALEKIGETAKAAAVYSELADSSAENRIKAEALHREGLIALTGRELERALELFDMLTESFPDSPEAALGAFYKSAAHYLRKEYDKALEAADNKILAESPEETEPLLYFLKAAAYFSVKDYEAARKFFRKALSNGGSTSERAAFYSGMCLHYSGKNEAAAEELEEFIGLFPESTLLHEAYFALGETMSVLKNFENAAKYYEKAGENSSLKDLAYLKRGFALNSADFPEQAISAYRRVEGKLKETAALKIAEILYFSDNFEAAAHKAASAGKENAQIHRQAKYILAAAYIRMGELGKGERELAEFIDLFPDSRYLPSAMFNLGAVHYKNRDYEKAHGAFEKIILSFPDEPEALRAKFLSGICLTKFGEEIEASKRLEEYVSKAEAAEKEEAALILGKLYLQAGRYKDARSMLAPLRESDNRAISAHACFQIGLALEEEKDYAAARTMFKEAIERESDEEKILEAMMRTAETYRMEKDYKRAFDAYRKISEEYPGHGILREVLYYAARMLQQMEKYSEAIKAFSEIPFPRTEEMEADVHLRKSDCLFKTGDYEEALLGYLRTAYLFPAQEQTMLTALESAAELLSILGRNEEAVKINKKIMELDPKGIKGERASQKLMEITQ